MQLKSLILNLAGALVLALGAAAPAAAIETGSAAWTKAPLVIYEGPGAQYRQLGSVEGHKAVRAERCSFGWCQISNAGPIGWVPQSKLAFGLKPGGWTAVRGLNDPASGPGYVCFFTGANFTGEKFCADSGDDERDLLLLGKDDTIASVAVRGNISVTVCRDRNYHSYCTRLEEDAPRLNRYLNNAVSSFRVH